MYKELNINKITIIVAMERRSEIKTSKQGINFLTFTGVYTTYFGNTKEFRNKKFSVKGNQIEYINKIPVGTRLYVEGFFNHIGTITVTHFQELNDCMGVL